MGKEDGQHSGPEAMGPGRRRFLKELAGFATLGTVASLAPGSRGIPAAFAQSGAPGTSRDEVPLSGTHAILLGTRGGPASI